MVTNCQLFEAERHQPSLGDGDANGYPVWLRLQGVRLYPTLANGAIFRVVTGSTRRAPPNLMDRRPPGFLAAVRNDLTGSGYS